MSTIRAQIMAKVATALAGATANKYENLDDALASTAAPALVYGWRADEVEEKNLLDVHTLTVAVEVYTRGASAESGADTLCNQAYGLFLADRSFGGLVKKLHIGDALRDSERVGGNGVLISQVFRLEYWTERGSLTVLA